MKKLLKSLLALSMALALCACGSKGSDTITGTYSMNVGGYDWGCGTDKVILTLDYVLDAVTAEDFAVTETKNMTNWGQNPNIAFGEAYEGETPLKITKAYLCDETGAETTEPSKNVALEIYVDPNTASPFIYSLATGLNSWCDPYYLTITTAEGHALTSGGKEVTSFTIDTTRTAMTTAADMFEEKQFTATDGTNYSYATYKKEGAKTMFVWLHGMGEGGTDTSITLLANKVTALAGEEFQNKVGGAHIVVPQCETFWMNEGTENPEMTGASIYTKSLDEFIESQKIELGAEKVVIGGCSNGGYMTMNMIMTYPEYFAAAYPICEAYADEWITDEMLGKIVNIPIWFTHSKSDQTVNVDSYTTATYNRLIAAGAKNVHFSLFENVSDTSGNYAGHVYDGHYSWIYTLNNECKLDFDGSPVKLGDKEVTIWEWLASQSK